MYGRDIVPEIDLIEALVRSGAAPRRARFEAGAREEAMGGRGVRRARRPVPRARARGRGVRDGVRGGARAPCAGIDPFGEARTRLCYGERLRRAGRRVDARRQLRAALETFERLEAAAWITRTRRELRATRREAGRRTAGIGRRAHPAGAAGRAPGRRGQDEQGGRRGALPQPEDRRVPPRAGLPEARLRFRVAN